MEISMIKKILQDGSPCDKCVQAEGILRRRGYWNQIDRVIYVKDGEENSEGVELARKHGVKVTPFFIVNENGEAPRVYTSLFEFMNKGLVPAPESPPRTSHQPKHPGTRSNQYSNLASNIGSEFETRAVGDIDIESANRRYSTLSPREILAHAQGNFGKKLALAFSGAEDVVLIDMACGNSLPFTAFCLDTGRLHPETYNFIEEIRNHYNLTLEIFTPSPAMLQPFLREKGINSFYQNGHAECCEIRKVEPLSRALKNHRAWITGLRRDQSPATRSRLKYIEMDQRNTNINGESLIKINPLLDWSSKELWDYIRTNKIPYNPLHDAGFRSIGCQPCTRPPRPGEHERAARWWWEDETKRECGIHIQPRV